MNCQSPTARAHDLATRFALLRGAWNRFRRGGRRGGHRRHEDVEPTLAWFDAKRSAHDPRGGFAAFGLALGVFAKLAVLQRRALEIKLTERFALWQRLA